MKKQIIREINIDQESLFTTIEEAINYLDSIKQAHPNKELTIHECWSSYEDNYFIATYQDIESDSEYEKRIKEERANRLSLEKELKKSEDEKKEKFTKEIATIYEKYGLSFSWDALKDIEYWVNIHKQPLSWRDIATSHLTAIIRIIESGKNPHGQAFKLDRARQELESRKLTE